ALAVFLSAMNAGTVEARDSAQLETGLLIFDRGQVLVQVEVADTPETRALGLMHRDELAADSGMLFVFPEEKIHGVWMKNTHIPLDIIFLSAEGEIVSWLQNVPPCVVEDCEIYRSAAPSRYMLEVNAGFIKHWSIRQDDKVSIVAQH
ncbi:MAG: DUF192 domain-containing protein, partial [Gammaproteobacteria bacterium]